MAPKDDGPLEEDLVCVGSLLFGARLRQIGILQAETLELRGPEREVRRIGFGSADAGVEGLRIVEEESRIEAAGQSRLQVPVESPGVAALEDDGRWYRRIRRKAANRTVLRL